MEHTHRKLPDSIQHQITHCTLISNPQWPMPVALWAAATGQIGMKSHFLACQPSSSIRDNKQKNFQAGDATHGYSACKICLISYFVHFEKYIVCNVGGLRSPSFESTVFCILNLLILYFYAVIWDTGATTTALKAVFPLYKWHLAYII